MLTISELFDLKATLAGEWLSSMTRPWEALKGIRAMILALGPELDREGYEQRAETVWVHRSARIAPTAFLGSAVIIGEDTEVRHCAFIRENALVGKHCVVGNSTELKNVILMDEVQVPHYNYVGDSILGRGAHMGAGAITSNVRGDKGEIVIHTPEGDVRTGLRKTGAFLGDGAEIGCNSVLNPGTVIGRGARVYPLSSVRGTVPPHSLYKRQGEIAVLRER